MSTLPLLGPDAVLLDLVARGKADVLKVLAARAAEIAGGDAGEIARALSEREALGSTGVGSAVALPHAAVRGPRAPLALFARLARPIDWGAIDDRPVDLVVAVLTPLDGGASLDPLARFARLLRGEATRNRLRACATAAEAIALLEA